MAVNLCYTIRIAGLVELDLLQHLLSNLEHRGTRLVIHLHLQGHVRDPDSRKQDYIYLCGLRYLGDHSRIHPQLHHPFLLSSYADSFRCYWPHGRVCIEDCWKRFHVVQLERR